MSAAGSLDLGRSWTSRRVERHLLAWCLLSITLGFILVLGSVQEGGGSLVWPDLLPLLGYALALIGIHLTLVATCFRGDQILVAAVAFLAGFGLLVQYRLGAFAGADAHTLLLFPAGILVLLATTAAFMSGRYRVLAMGPWAWGGLSLVLVATLLVTGHRFRGGVYALGFTTPTEALKLTVILFLTGLIARQSQALGQWQQRFYIPLPPWRPLWPLAVFWVVLVGLLAVQRDLGMTIILSIGLLTLLSVGTRHLGYLAYGLIAAGALGVLAATLFEHAHRRIEAWTDPFADPTGDGWQILQGLSGMYSGGLWGEGFGQGSPGFTPIAGSDFIYSVVGEELGFVGCAVILLFFLIVFARGIQISRQSRDQVGTLLATGLTVVLVAQTFLNVGGVTKLVPLTGITLPLISHGGTSLLTAFAALGLLLAVSDTASGSSPKAPARTPRASTRSRTPKRTQAANGTAYGINARPKPKSAPKRKRTSKQAS